MKISVKTQMLKQSYWWLAGRVLRTEQDVKFKNLI